MRCTRTGQGAAQEGLGTSWMAGFQSFPVEVGELLPPPAGSHGHHAHHAVLCAVLWRTIDDNAEMLIFSPQGGLAASTPHLVSLQKSLIFCDQCKPNRRF